MGLEQAVVRTTLSMISRFGVAGIVQRATGIEYKPTTGDVAVAEENHEIKVILGPVDKRVLNPAEAQAQVTFAAQGLTFEPVVGDRVRVHRRTYTIQQVRKIYALGTLALYVCGVSS